MLDVLDFVSDRGGNPKAIRESQRRRFAPEEVVDEVIALYEDHRKSTLFNYFLEPSLIRFHIANYAASQVGNKINANKKEIGLKKKVSQI